MATEILTHAEAKRLVILEEKIEGSLETFLSVGSALMEIQENKLYRSQHSTFEAYCVDRWQMSGRRGRQLATAAKITECLEIGTRVPTLEVQVRPLSQVPEEARSEVWNEAVDEAGDKPPTMKQVQHAVDRKLGKPNITGHDGETVAGGYGRVVLEETVNEDAQTAVEAADNHAEAAAERAAIQTEQTDEEWVKSLPLYSQLSGVQQKTFIDDAMRYKFMEKTLESAKKKSSEAINKFRRMGPFGNRLRRFFCGDAPEKWLLCPATEDGGCGGEGSIKVLGGSCPKCRGYGFWIKG